MNPITTELVETIAAARVNSTAEHLNSLPAEKLSDVPAFALKGWEDQGKLQQYAVRESVLKQLNEITPHLIDAGWLPPAKHDAIRETVRDRSLNELHKPLMGHLKLDPVGSGYTSSESINGYSEGAEHGTISLASRIKTILDGE